MKAGCVMCLKCVECGKKYDIADNELDDYNIYWVEIKGKIDFLPRLLCPVCTKIWTQKTKR